MAGMAAVLKIVREPVGTQELVPLVAQLLRRASISLERDAQAARREIQSALELLSSAPVPAAVQPDQLRRPRPALAPWQMRRVVDHIRENLETPISVEAMADVTRLSTSYFFRAFKRSFGMSPHAYAVALRLSHARELLMANDEPVSRIAAACGFADQAHFSRAFRRGVGSAPGAWRREQRALLTPGPNAAFDTGADPEA